MLRYISFSAVTLGLMVNLLASIFLSVVVSLFWVSVWTAQDLSQAQIALRFEQPFEYIGLGLMVIAFGGLADLIGGFVAANKANTLEYWHALLVLVLAFIIFQFLPNRGVPMWVSWLSLTLGAGASCYGAYLAKLRKQEKSS